MGAVSMTLGREAEAQEASIPSRKAAGVGMLAAAVPAALLSGTFTHVAWREGPLPMTMIAAALLFFAVHQDLRWLRIPNWLTYPCLLLAIGTGYWIAGTIGLQTALIGAAMAFLLLVIPYAVGWLGAGDVKAVMVLGALWGHHILGPAVVWMLLCGAAFAAGWIIVRGELGDMLSRWLKTARTSLATGRPMYFSPPPGSAAAAGLPFAIAIAAGSIAYRLLGPPWL